METQVKLCAGRLSYFIITGSSQTLLEKEVKPLVIGFLQERGLELSQEKTKITHIADGFDFLGQNIRKYNGLLLTRPSKKNVKAFLTDIRETIKGHKQATAYGLIALLNPKIQGWANYHRYGASSKTFVHVDWAINKALWQWAKRRHPKKSTHWIQKRYYCQIGNQNWCFFGTAKAKDGQSIQKVLCHSQVHQDQRGMQPLRSRMETVPIRSTRKEDGYDPTEQTPTIEALGRTGRHLPELQPANHEGNGLAQPPHRPQSEGWKQREREPRSCTSQLP